MSKKTPICAYCGQLSTKLTRDHVIPRGIWGGKGNLPPHVVVVPACLECQQEWDLQAEYFRNSLIAMIDKGAHPIANHVLEGPVIRSLERNRKARAAFFRNTRFLPRRSPGGIVTGYGLAREIDWERFSKVIEKIVRGLFFHKSRVPLPKTHSVQIFPNNQFWANEGFQNLLGEMEPVAGFGDDVFRMRCVRDMSDPSCTAWLLIFFQQMAFFAWTRFEEQQSYAESNGAPNGDG